MSKRLNTTKKKSNIKTSKTGQIYHHLCQECKKPFQPYPKKQQFCSHKCTVERAKVYEANYKLKKLQLACAELERQIFTMELENEVMGCRMKPEVVAHMMNVMEYYESNSTQ